MGAVEELKLLQEIKSLLVSINSKLDSKSEERGQERLLTMKEARARLGVNQDTLRRLIERGQIATAAPGNRAKVVEKSLNRYIKGVI